MVGFVLVCWCAGLLADAGECLGYVWYDIMECLLKTSSLGLLVVHMFYLTTDCDRFIRIIHY